MKYLPYCFLINHLTPAFQQGFPLSWGYKSWPLAHERGWLSMDSQEVRPLCLQFPSLALLFVLSILTPFWDILCMEILFQPVHGPQHFGWQLFPPPPNSVLQTQNNLIVVISPGIREEAGTVGSPDFSGGQSLRTWVCWKWVWFWKRKLVIKWCFFFEALMKIRAELRPYRLFIILAHWILTATYQAKKRRRKEDLVTWGLSLFTSIIGTIIILYLQ